jgi:ABC-2 type transport system permease protein
MAGAGVMATTLSSGDIPFYLGVMAAGFIISIAIGACIGIIASNQMAATSLSLPVMLIFSFMPMLAMFNDKIEKIAGIFYTQQIRELLGNMTFDGIKTETMLVVAVNALLALSLFFAAFKRKGLE